MASSNYRAPALREDRFNKSFPPFRLDAPAYAEVSLEEPRAELQAEFTRSIFDGQPFESGLLCVNIVSYKSRLTALRK